MPNCMCLIWRPLHVLVLVTCRDSSIPAFLEPFFFPLKLKDGTCLVEEVVVRERRGRASAGGCGCGLGTRSANFGAWPEPRG
jgi:hypothetical protein